MCCRKAATLPQLMQNHVHPLPSLAKHAGRTRTSPGKSKRRGRTGQSVEQKEGLPKRSEI